MSTGILANLNNGTYTITSVLTDGPVGVANEIMSGSWMHIAAVQPDAQRLASQNWEITRSKDGYPGRYNLTILNMYTVEDTSVGEVHAISPNVTCPAENWVITEFDRGHKKRYTIENHTQTRGWLVNSLIAGGVQTVDCQKLQKNPNYGGPSGTPAQVFEINPLLPPRPPSPPRPTYPPLEPGYYKMKSIHPRALVDIGGYGPYVCVAGEGAHSFDGQTWHVEKGSDGLYTLSVNNFFTTADRAQQSVRLLPKPSPTGTRWVITGAATFSGYVAYTIQTEDRSIGWRVSETTIPPGLHMMDCKPLSALTNWEATAPEIFIFT